jgi:hypothetical protein
MLYRHVRRVNLLRANFAFKAAASVSDFLSMRRSAARRIGIAIPGYERPALTVEAFRRVYGDRRLASVTISDDASSKESFDSLIARTKLMKSVSVHRSATNQDTYFNKKAALALSPEPWNILLDNDNEIATDYLDRLFEIDRWDEETIYAPRAASLRLHGVCRARDLEGERRQLPR